MRLWLIKSGIRIPSYTIIYMLAEILVVAAHPPGGCFAIDELRASAIDELRASAIDRLRASAPSG